MNITGIITAMVTPLDESGINELATRKLVRKLLADEVNGLFILGTNGEFYGLSKAEKLELAKIVVDEVNGVVPVFAGAGGISTTEVIELTNQFEEIGVDAVSIITPFLIKLNEEEVVNHYEEILLKTELPIILYNIPKNTGINISTNIYKRLLKHEKIIGIKDSGGDISQIEKYISLNQRDDFSVLVGSDSLILEALKLGADGAVAATSNFLTKTDVGIYQAYLAKDVSLAARLQESIEDFRAILKFASVPSVLKYTLTLTGYNVGVPKLPVMPVNSANKTEILKVLKKYQAYENFEVKFDEKN
ncbi:4-hydroxy-tetrahydrodipicolinate synthase [Enterococcus sp. PF1-24]|uniref:dihydrodipicolinate synthase family protein n=1 Tax=unclassified Enterococcus TaxID=2608891 RepID=UPI0024751EA5|nr:MULTISPECIES: dihydrodipicolinate synthase family protein [unclassified Enterococcus]MDH6365589.1 4-hydroxy-tetrahydrodipicolinate synthase [Enterococcus sp. PFB1-1]MDH6402695.1 4-hydroxy-tetrahydrodipicolinate synthase [Enterococcus sp. PF1-24]